MEALSIRHYSDVTEFRSLVEPFLLEHEATHCLQLGLLEAMEYGDWPERRLAVVTQQAQPVLVLMQTPPRPLILSHTASAEAVRVAAADVQAGEAADWPAQVMAPAEVAELFQEAWTATGGRSATLADRERIYQLDRVTPVSGIAGTARRATSGEFDLLVNWYTAFCSEAGIEPASDVAAAVERKLNSTGLNGLWVWDVDGRAVSFLGSGSPTLNGVRIGPVYTPRDQRNHGYASALVAHVSQYLLDSGRKFCFLFTDLANPTSNHIYQEIGYRPTSDINKLTLT